MNKYNSFLKSFFKSKEKKQKLNLIVFQNAFKLENDFLNSLKI